MFYFPAFYVMTSFGILHCYQCLFSLRFFCVYSILLSFLVNALSLFNNVIST